MNWFRMAKSFYPKYWSKEDLQFLVSVDKLTLEQYKELTGEEYTTEIENTASYINIAK